MAKEMKGAHWDKYGRRRVKAPIKYPWDEWLNGSMWLLVQGDDFKGKNKKDTFKFREYIHAYAKNHNIKVKTKLHQNGRDLYIKAYANTTREGLERSAHFLALKLRRREIEDGLGRKYYYEEDLPEEQWRYQESGEYEDTTEIERSDVDD